MPSLRQPTRLTAIKGAPGAPLRLVLWKGRCLDVPRAAQGARGPIRWALRAALWGPQLLTPRRVGLTASSQLWGPSWLLPPPGPRSGPWGPDEAPGGWVPGWA